MKPFAFRRKFWVHTLTLSLTRQAAITAHWWGRMRHSVRHCHARAALPNPPRPHAQHHHPMHQDLRESEVQYSFFFFQPLDFHATLLTDYLVQIHLQQPCFFQQRPSPISRLYWVVIETLAKESRTLMELSHSESSLYLLHRSCASSLIQSTPSLKKAGGP